MHRTWVARAGHRGTTHCIATAALHPSPAHSRRCSLSSLMTDYTFDFAADGGDIHAILDAGGAECLLKFDHDDWLLAAVEDLPQEAMADAEVGVPMWAMAVCFEYAIGVGDADAAESRYAADTIIHAQTLAYAKDAAADADFHLDAEGEPRVWPTMGAFADSFKIWADDRRKSGDAAPVLAYDEDFVDLDHPAAFPEPQYAYLNRLMLSDLECEGIYFPWMRMHYLLYPMTPVLDLTGSDDDRQAIVARLILSTAKRFDPATAEASEKLAVLSFLAGEVPYQLVKHGVSLPDRVAYIKLLEEWAVTAKRPGLVAKYFSRVLKHEPNLAGWVETTAEPHRSFVKLLQAVFKSSEASQAADLEAVGRLEEALPSYDDYWSDARSAQGNVDYLVADLQRRQGHAPRSGSAGDGSVDDAGEAAGAMAQPGLFARELEALDRAILHHYEAANPSAFEAIRLVTHSGATPAIRWLFNKGGSLSQLPQSLRRHCAALPAKLDEYVVDSIKHDDSGSMDPDLEELTVDVFYKHEATKSAAKRAFFLSLYSGAFTTIAWEKDYVHRIALLLDEHATPAASAQQIYGDETRRNMHTLYVGRVLDCLGKLVDDEYSYENIVKYWEPALAKATRAGHATKQDALAQVDALMKAVWQSGEQEMASSLTAGTPWTAGLADSTIGAFDTFSKWRDDLADVQKFNKRFKYTAERVSEPAHAHALARRRHALHGARTPTPRPPRSAHAHVALPRHEQPSRGMRAGHHALLGAERPPRSEQTHGSHLTG